MRGVGRARATTRAAAGLLLGACLGSMGPGGAAAQQVTEFDPQRVRPGGPFDAFLVGDGDVRRLSEALEDGAVHEATALLMLDLPSGRLALATDQLSYHHVAQGDMMGEPWMVSF